MLVLFSLVGVGFGLVSVGIVTFLYTKHRSVNIFRLILFGEIFFFGLMFFVTLFSLLDSTVPIDNVKWIHRIGMLSGHVGAITWFLIFDRIEVQFHHLNRIVIQRVLVFLIGISYALNFFTIQYQIIDGRWQITYHPFGIFFLIIVYGSFTAYQYKLFFHRVTQYARSKNFPKLSSFFYFLTMTLAIVTFVIGGPIFKSPYIWIFFGGLSQFFLSYLFIKIPTVLLTHEEPQSLLILTEGGVILFSKNFTEEIQIEKDLIGGFLTAIDILGKEILDQKDEIQSINYKNQILLTKTLQKIKFIYVYTGTSYYAPYKLKKFISLIQTNQDIWNNLQSASRNLNNLEDVQNKQIHYYINKLFI